MILRANSSDDRNYVQKFNLAQTAQRAADRGELSQERADFLKAEADKANK